MKFFWTFIVYAFFLACFAAPLAFNIQAQETKGALLRGYRTGYSDGYMAGYRDSVERAQRSFARHQDYVKANRVYRAQYGSLEEYRDGYQQGFESGYDTGFDRREFDSALPAVLNRRGATKDAPVNSGKSAGGKSTAPRINGSTAKNKKNAAENPNEAQNVNAGYNQPPTIIIPSNTEIIVEMLADVNTETSREGDSFLAKVIAPGEIAGAVIEGRITKLRKPARVRGNAELQLSFNRIVVNEKRWSNFNAVVIEALPMKGSNIKAIDEEGTVRGKSSLKTDTIKVGAAAGTGLTVGAIAGGPVGAAVGAAVGGAVGIGGVLIERGKNINLVQGQQLRVKTNFESQIR